MPGFFSELGPSIRQHHDRALEHLKSMCCILSMIEHMQPGQKIEITAVSQPDPKAGVYWSIMNVPAPEEQFRIEKGDPPLMEERTELPVEASRLIMREIEERTETYTRMSHWF